MLRLVFSSEVLNGMVHELAEGKTSVGRSSFNLLTIPDDSVSRRHAELLIWGSEVIVRDCGSRNGTWVGDRPVRNGQCPVMCGDLIRFGSMQARLEMDRANTECRNLDASLDDVTAVHHYSKFRQEGNSVKNDLNKTPPPAFGISPWPECGEHTMLVQAAREDSAQPGDSSSTDQQEIDSPVPRLPALLRWLMSRG